ncbi:MAG: sulfur transferase domain-containing protein [Thermoanaerobaculia bacterium]
MTTRSLALTLVLATWLAALAWIGIQALADAQAEETVTAAGTVDIPNAKMPFAGVLTGGQATEEALAAAAAAGYRTVVNLRSEKEMAEIGWDEAAAVEALGMEYVFIPMAGAAGLTVDNAHRLAAVLDEPESHPVMIHCASGNRVGAMLALKAFHIDGQDADAALELGLEAGLTRLAEPVREHLANAQAKRADAGEGGKVGDGR